MFKEEALEVLKYSCSLPSFSKMIESSLISFTVAEVNISRVGREGEMENISENAGLLIPVPGIRDS